MFLGLTTWDWTSWGGSSLSKTDSPSAAINCFLRFFSCMVACQLVLSLSRSCVGNCNVESPWVQRCLCLWRTDIWISGSFVLLWSLPRCPLSFRCRDCRCLFWSLAPMVGCSLNFDLLRNSVTALICRKRKVPS